MRYLTDDCFPKLHFDNHFDSLNLLLCLFEAADSLLVSNGSSVLLAMDSPVSSRSLVNVMLAMNNQVNSVVSSLYSRPLLNVSIYLRS